MITADTILDNIVDHFMQVGIKSVSMDDIAHQFGISKKTLYQHFDNKKDLVNQAISKHIQLEQSLINEISRNSTDAVEEMVQIAEYTVIHFGQIKPALIHDLQKYYSEIWEKVMSYQSEYYIDKIKTNLQRGQHEEYYRSNLNPEIIAKLYVAKSLSLVNEQLFSLTDYDRETLITQHILYHLHGILSHTGLQYLDQFKLFKV